MFGFARSVRKMFSRGRQNLKPKKLRQRSLIGKEYYIKVELIINITYEIKNKIIYIIRQTTAMKVEAAAAAAAAAAPQLAQPAARQARPGCRRPGQLGHLIAVVCLMFYIFSYLIQYFCLIKLSTFILYLSLLVGGGGWR